MTLIRIIGTATGEPHPFDGQFLAAYDPTVLADYSVLIKVTADPARAKTFAGPGEALEEWRRTNGRIRPDGRPDRPLTAFTVELVDG